MSYIVFARKYRPQAFSEIIGQSHITTTLENAVSQDRVAHAYLFAGPRGIGKTTTARILAKALNCERGPTPSPCNRCASCIEITHGASLDILEIDGASNRGIEEIRNLRDNIKFSPSKGKFKVYIIDEVHMLTEPAFNALLKTLEEPPPHVKFIFATTHAHKVPATILSRCQRFDFKRISTKDILVNLRKIADNESLDIADDAARLIAKYSDGSMRDAEVILDQMTSCANVRITIDDVMKILGMVGEDILFGLSASIRDKDPAAALKMIDSLAADGKDIVHVVINIIEHFRNLSVVKISKGLSSLVDVPAESIKRYEEEADAFSIEEILYVIYTLSNTIDFIRKSSMAKVPFEAAMIKLTRMGSVVSLAEIAKRVDEIEASLRGAIRQTQGDEALRLCSGLRPSTKAQDEAIPKSVPRNDLSLDEIAGSWNSIVNYIKSKKISVALYLHGGVPVARSLDTVSIGFAKENSFSKDVLSSPENRQFIEESIKEMLGIDLKIKFILDENLKSPETASYSTERPEASPSGGPADNVDPIIKEAMEMFGGELRQSGKELAR